MTETIEDVQRRLEDGVLWITLNRPDAGNAMTRRDAQPDHRAGSTTRPSTPRCAPSCSPAPARRASAPAPTCAAAAPRPPERPEGAPERIVGDAARTIRTGMPAPDRVDPRLREAGDRGRQRHRGRRRHAPRARLRPRDHGRGGALHRGVRPPRASSPTPAAPTCSRGSSARRRPRSCSSSATTSPAAEAERIGLVNKVVPARRAREDAQRVGRAPRPEARPRPSGSPSGSPTARSTPTAHGAFWDEAYAQELVDPHGGHAGGPGELRRAPAARVQGLVADMARTADRTGPRSSASGRRRSPRACPTPSCRSRARRSRPRSTTPASRRARSTGWRSFSMEAGREVEVARNVGLGDITFFSQVGYGGGAGCGVVGHAAMAVATGQCNVAVAWRARKRAAKAQPAVGAGEPAHRRSLAVEPALRPASARSTRSRCSRAATCTSSARPASTSPTSRWRSGSTPTATRRRRCTTSR